MEKLRLPFFIAALAACGLCILLELGSNLLPADAVDVAALVAQSKKVAAEHDEELEDDQIAKIRSMSGGPPGRAIPALALVDGLLFYVVALYGLAFLISDAAHGRVRGILSLVVSILLLLASIAVIFVELALLLLKVGLFVAVPFGTIVYLARYGFFDQGGANVALSVLMSLKIAFCILLLLAHPRFLKIKSLVLLTLTSLLGNLIIGFLHGLVPVFLKSILDSLAAIICAVLALIWSLYFVIPSLIGTLKAIKK